MKNKLLLFFCFWGSFALAQTIHLSEAHSTNEINDRRLFRIQDSTYSKLLGKIEVVGHLDRETDAFNKFYQKAKTIGANTYIYHVEKDLNGDDIQSNVKIISLYYTPSIIENANKFYVFGSNKSQKIIVDGKSVELSPGTFIEGMIKEGEQNYISTRRILGSRINLHYKINQPEQYFQALTGGIKSDNSGVTGGLVLKTGDIVMLEKSFANFLTLFYKKIN